MKLVSSHWALPVILLLIGMFQRGAVAQAVLTVGPLPVVVTGSSDHVLKVWNGLGQQSYSIVAHSSIITCVTITPDNRHIVSADDQGSIKVWSVDQGMLETTIALTGGPALSLAVSPDSKQILSGHSDHTFSLWNLQTGKCTRTVTGHERSVNAVAWRPDGLEFASAGSDRLIQLWHADVTAAGTVVSQDQPVTALVWSLDGKHLIAGEADGNLRIWRTSDLSQELCLRAHDRAITAIALSPTGDILATADTEGRVKLWQVRVHTLVAGPAATCPRSATCLSWGPTGTVLIAGCADGNLRYLDGHSLMLLKLVHAHDGPVTGMAVAQ